MELIVEAVTDQVKTVFPVTDLTPRARKHKRYQVDVPDDHIRILHQRPFSPLIEEYVCVDGRRLVVSHAWQRRTAIIMVVEQEAGGGKGRSSCVEGKGKEYDRITMV